MRIFDRLCAMPLLAFLIGPSPAMAQTEAAPATVRFEVASVKISKLGGGVRGGCHGINSKYGPNDLVPPLGRCVITDGRLSHLINIAWNLRSIQMIKGATNWMIAGDDRFNIEAKAEDPTHTTEQQLLQMLQALLVERFQLKFHQETVDQSGFALVVGKNGPKLQQAAGQQVTTKFGSAGGKGTEDKPMPGRPISLTARGYSMERLANMLSMFGTGPVVDKTGLPGTYDFTLAWDEEAGPSLSTAVRDLGLRLESQKVPVALFVIDSAQRPREN